MTSYNSSEIFEKLKRFLDKNSSKYPEAAVEFLLYRMAIYDLNPNKCDILSQIYDELGLLQKKDDCYQAFTEKLKKKYSLNRPVIEVGGGFIPSLGRRIAQVQISLDQGSITVYDPYLIGLGKEEVILKKEFFKTQSLQGNELLVGFFPCEGTRAIIEQGIKYDVDFSIQLCGCVHEKNVSDVSTYHKQLIENIKNKLPQTRTLDVDYLDSEYQIPYPMISSIKKKVKK